MSAVSERRAEAHRAVVAELNRRGWSASIGSVGTRDVHVRAQQSAGNRVVRVLVRTKLDSNHAWRPNANDENRGGENVFFVFVNVADSMNGSSFHIVPSLRLVELIRANHHDWLKKPRRDGAPHVDSSLRKFTDPNDEYLNRWDFLDSSGESV